MRVWLVRDIDEPEIGEPSVHSPSAYPATLGDLSERGRTGGVGVDIVEVAGSCLVEAFVCGGPAAVGVVAPPAYGAGCGGAVFLH